MVLGSPAFPGVLADHALPSYQGSPVLQQVQLVQDLQDFLPLLEDLVVQQCLELHGLLAFLQVLLVQSSLDYLFLLYFLEVQEFHVDLVDLQVQLAPYDLVPLLVLESLEDHLDRQLQSLL